MAGRKARAGTEGWSRAGGSAVLAELTQEPSSTASAWFIAQSPASSLGFTNSAVLPRAPAAAMDWDGEGEQRPGAAVGEGCGAGACGQEAALEQSLPRSWGYALASFCLQ